jgi:hypothetical protein
MPGNVTRRHGEMEVSSADKIPSLIAELDDPDDGEHSAVSVSDESGWTIIGFPDGLVVWENVEDEEGEGGYAGPRHMENVPREDLDHLMRLVVSGDLASIEEMDWRRGYEPDDEGM